VDYYKFVERRTTMTKKWEYMVVNIGFLSNALFNKPRIETDLNREGEKSWELVNVAGEREEEFYAFFKREKVE